MKVAVVTDYFPTSASRWAGHSAYQTLRLLARRCDLHVFYPESNYPRLLTPASRRPASRGPASLDPAWSPPDVPATYIPYPALPVLTRPLNGFTSAHALLPQVRRFAPDLILNYVVYPAGHAAVRLAEALHVPAVLTAIGSDLNRIPDPLCGRLIRTTLRRASFVTTVSHDLARTAISLGADPTRTRAILNGCDTTVFHPGDRADARRELNLDPAAEIVLYVGRLDQRKGLRELIEAVATLRATRPRLHCYLVGDGTDRPLLAQAIAQYSAAATITLIPACLTDRIALWMAAADLVTLPSYKEGCPNVVIEALSAGRPVVATHVGGIPELMDDTSGRLIPSHDVPALTRVLDEVLAAPWDPATLSAHHSRSWADVATDLHAVLEEVMQQR